MKLILSKGIVDEKQLIKIHRMTLEKKIKQTDPPGFG